MRAMVLAYGYEGKELKTLKTVCARQGLRLRQARETELSQPVGAFFGLSAYEEGRPPQAPLPGRLLVLGGLTSPQLDAFLSALKTARAGESLKAVLTQHNASWDGSALYQTLLKERQELESKGLSH